MPRTREEMIAAAARARAVWIAKAKQAQQQRGRGSMKATSAAGRSAGRSAAGSAGSSGSATATARKPRMVKANAGRQRSGLQPIQSDRDYPLPVFLQFTGLTLATIRTCQRRGLRVRRHGNKRFISGEEWLDWTRRQDEAGGDRGGEGGDE